MSSCEETNAIKPEHNTSIGHTAGSELLHRFQQLHRLSITNYRDFEERYRDYLETGLKLFDTSFGIVSQIQNQTYRIAAIAPDTSALTAGQTFALPDTYCTWVVANNCTVAIEHVGADVARRAHPVYQNFQLETYIAAPIWVNGAIFGTLNFSDGKVREVLFTEEDKALIELMAHSLGHYIEQDLLTRERSMAAIRMQENTELFESAFKFASVGMALVSPDGRWLRVNNAICEIVGYTSEELLSINFQTITHPKDLDIDLCFVKEMLDGNRDSYAMEKRYIHKDTHTVWAMLSVSLVRDSNGAPRYFISQIQDITELKVAQMQLEKQHQALQDAHVQMQKLATLDSLTQILNRRAFDEQLHLELHRINRDSLPLSLVLIDIDHFKQYNDKFGHPAGDKALQLIATALEDTCRINDTLARYGGEEFAAILPNTDEQGSLIMGQRLLSAIEKIQQTERPVTASIGIMTLEKQTDKIGADAAGSLIKCADIALYHAKAAGRGCAVHYEQLPA